MTDLIIVIIGGALLALYIVRIAGYGFTLFRSLRKDGDPLGSDEIAVTLLIPVRNEADNLPGLMQDIQAQTYPSHIFEVLFIDDHSDDGSAEIIKNLSEESDNIRLLHLPQHLVGKKEAINMGVREARTDHIIQTDADCRISGTFIRAHAEAAGSDSQTLIAGPVRHESSRALLDNFEALEFMSLIGTSMASFLCKRPVMCNGANLSYSKAFYLRNEQELRRIPSPSGDDMFLLIRAKKEGMKLKYLAAKSAAVTTGHTGTLKAFLHQRIRWGSKARHYADLEMIYLTLLILFTNIYILGTLIASTIDHSYLLIFGAALLIKSLADLILLTATAKHLNRMRLLWYFPVVALFYYFYLVLTGVLSLFKSYSWKGRKIKTTDH